MQPVAGSQHNWKLCYRASAHGWSSRTFHSRCDGKPHTVTIIRKYQYVFGGYTDIAWGMYAVIKVSHLFNCVVYSKWQKKKKKKKKKKFHLFPLFWISLKYITLLKYTTLLKYITLLHSYPCELVKVARGLSPRVIFLPLCVPKNGYSRFF